MFRRGMPSTLRQRQRARQAFSRRNTRPSDKRRCVQPCRGARTDYRCAECVGASAGLCGFSRKRARIRANGGETDTASTLPVAANRMEDATMIRVWCVTVVMLAYATAASAQTSSRTLSLDEAIAIAVEQNRTLANATLAAEDADHNVAAARTHLLPAFKVETQASQLLTPVDITFSRGAFGDFPATGPVPSTDTTLTTPRKLTTVVNASVSQPLTQLHEIGLRVRMAEAGRDVEREQARSVRVALVGDVKRLYYSILQTYSARNAARA